MNISEETLSLGETKDKQQKRMEKDERRPKQFCLLRECT